MAKGAGGGASSGRGTGPASGSYSLDRNNLISPQDAGSHIGLDGLTLSQLGNLVGAPTGTILSIQRGATHGSGAPGITISGFGREIGNLNREIFVRDGKLVIYNNQIQKTAGVGPGFAKRSLDKQKSAARKAGVSRIESFATGSKGTVYNGYYTLPRMGYDGKIPHRVKEKLPAKYKSAETVQQLFRKKGGKEWWKQNGSSFEAHINL